VAALFDCKTQSPYGIRSDPGKNPSLQTQNQKQEPRIARVSNQQKLLFVKRFLDEQWPVDLCDNVL
jgi:hypothetical protein